MQKSCHHTHRQSGRQINGNAVFIFFMAFSLFNLFLGVGLCLVKSPQSKSQYYLSLSQNYQTQLIDQETVLQHDAENYLLEKAKEAALISVQQNPYDAQTWQQLSSLWYLMENKQKALQAAAIAKMLGFTPDSTIKMPLLLPSRNVALTKAMSQTPDIVIVQ